MAWIRIFLDLLPFSFFVVVLPGVELNCDELQKSDITVVLLFRMRPHLKNADVRFQTTYEIVPNLISKGSDFVSFFILYCEKKSNLCHKRCEKVQANWVCEHFSCFCPRLLKKEKLSPSKHPESLLIQRDHHMNQQRGSISGMRASWNT